MNARPDKTHGLLDRNEELTTADIAQAGKREEFETGGAILEAKDAPPEMMKPTPAQQSSTPLFANNEAQDFRIQWEHVQTSFVDEPRKAVEEADSLVAGVIQRLAEVFAEERSKLETQWDRGDNISTEDLRLALQRYRSFFTRLLSV